MFLLCEFIASHYIFVPLALVRGRIVTCLTIWPNRPCSIEHTIHRGIVTPFPVLEYPWYPGTLSPSRPWCTSSTSVEFTRSSRPVPVLVVVLGSCSADSWWAIAERREVRGWLSDRWWAMARRCKWAVVVWFAGDHRVGSGQPSGDERATSVRSSPNNFKQALNIKFKSHLNVNLNYIFGFLFKSQ